MANDETRKHFEGELTGVIAADGKSPERWVKAHYEGCKGGDCPCPWTKGYYDEPESETRKLNQKEH